MGTALLRSSYTTLMSPTYTRAILSAHPANVQMLSVLDVSMQFPDRLAGFLQGRSVSGAVFPNPLVM